jgi:hypothetical protein
MRKEFKKGLDHPLMELARARKAMSEVEGTAAEIDNYISTRFAELMEKYDKASPEDLIKDAEQSCLERASTLDLTGYLRERLEQFIKEAEEEFCK